MKRLRVLFGLLVLSLMMVMHALAADYDVIINNGRIVVKDSKVLKDVFPGQPIRASPQE